MQRFKKLTKNRAITIPKDLAAEFGVTGGEAVEISCTGGIITIKKRVPKCRFCGDVIQAKTFKNIDVCPNCAKELKEAVSGGSYQEKG